MKSCQRWWNLRDLFSSRKPRTFWLLQPLLSIPLWNLTSLPSLTATLSRWATLFLKINLLSQSHGIIQKSGHHHAYRKLVIENISEIQTIISFLRRIRIIFLPFVHLQPIMIPFLSSVVELLDLKIFLQCYKENTLARFRVNNICFVVVSLGVTKPTAGAWQMNALMNYI